MAEYKDLLFQNARLFKLALNVLGLYLACVLSSSIISAKVNYRRCSQGKAMIREETYLMGNGLNSDVI